jgi:multiple sugar transport system permease protein
MGVRELIVKIVDHTATPYVVCSIISFFMLTPFFWMLSSAFKTMSETFRSPPTYIPEDFTLETMYEAWMKAPVPTYVLNSLYISLITTIIVITAATFTAYGLSQYSYKGSGAVLGLFLFTRTIPPLSLLLPYYLILMTLGLINTLTSVILYTIYLCYPLVVWILKGFFDAFPRELIESALVDGCSRTGAIFRIVLPVAATGIFAAAVISFMWSWNEFFAPYLFIHSDELKPITVGIYYFVGDELVYWNFMCAGGIYAIIPSLLFFLLAQRYIVRGLTAGALKY